MNHLRTIFSAAAALANLQGLQAPEFAVCTVKANGNLAPLHMAATLAEAISAFDKCLAGHPGASWCIADRRGIRVLTRGRV